MFDLPRTFSLMKDILLAPESTGRAYCPESDRLDQTFGLFILPGAILAPLVPHILFAGLQIAGLPEEHQQENVFRILDNFVFWVIASIAGMLLFLGVSTIVATSLAKAFKGRCDYRRGLAAVSLASVPLWIGWILLTVPPLGILTAPILVIYALLLLSRLMPIFLEVPQDGRLGHFFASAAIAAPTFSVLLLWFLADLFKRGSLISPSI